MRPYWNQVCSRVKLLSEIIFASEADDKIDLELVLEDPKKSARKFSAKKSSELFEFLKKHRPPDGKPDTRVTNPGRIVKNILDTYAKKIREGKFKRTFTKIAKKAGHQALTLYVITDGCYQQHSDFGTPIKNTISVLDELEREGRIGSEDRFVGVQFIRFGDDAEGFERLEDLDKLQHNAKLSRYVFE